MDSVNNWLELAKQHNLKVTNEADTDDLSLCINLLTIADTNTVAVTVSFVKDRRKKNSAPPQAFAKIMRLLERIMRDIDDEGAKLTDRFQPVNLSTQWYTILNCHRIFFITESAVPDLVTLLIRYNCLIQLKSQGIAELRLIANTQQYRFNIKL